MQANCVVALLFTALFVPETCGRSLEDISEDFRLQAAAASSSSKPSVSESNSGQYQTLGGGEEDDDEDSVLMLHDYGDDHNKGLV